MITQLLEKERIRTTLPKAMALKQYADRVITMGKQGTQQAWDKACGIVRTDRERHKLFTTMALRYRDRQGGYTRVVKAGWRERDAAPLAFIEFVDWPGELRPAEPPKTISPLLPFSVQAYLRQQQQQQQQQS
eukprot:CAMPEP_0202920328 /NCGR_PEP_ID=MMETSP1392-20130828/76801_1 /ASSEMBLY_ACC=CAM_ASM_000868 /TAXON_ID=225041 /ORGANISM="Chlamydomonas chlamydogama, Strain SAG 11-48b" /LENGTH=131 /DNA_ID=CAMNT_0049613819 /DNA_START=188 /DNA_END=583 /DNA_ORIENTATION=+